MKLDLGLKKKIKEHELGRFERDLIRTIFSGDNKQLIFKKYQTHSV